MRTRWLWVLLLVAVGGLGFQEHLRGAEVAEADSLVGSLPAGALGTVEIAGLAPIIERIETSEVLRDYLGSPLYDDLLKTPPARKAVAGKAILEAQLGMDLWSFAKVYLGDRIALGLYPPSGGKQPDGVLIVRVKNESDLARLVEKLTPLLALAGNHVSISDHDRGGKVLKFRDGNQAVLTGRYIVASKSNELLTAALDHLKSATSGGLPAEPAWQTMARQMRSRHTIQVCVKLSRVQELHGKRLIPDRLDNPVVSLLYGGIMEFSASSPYWGMTLDVQESGVSVQSALAGRAADLDEARRSTLVDPSRPLVPLVPAFADQLGAISLSRDLLTWYRSREQLLEARLLPEFDKFETGLATFLGDKDFAEDVLPLLTGRIALVSAPQDYSYLDGKPGVQLPAFGVVVELARPREGSDILNLVAQTILTISNLEASKQKRKPWVQSSETYHDVQINFARYLDRPQGDQLATAYNFQPASALVGNQFVLSSSLGLCRQLIDTLSAKASPDAAAGEPSPQNGIPNFVQRFSPAVAATLLEANAAVIHAKNIQNGKTAEQSARELDAVCQLLRRLTSIRFDTVQYPDHVRLELHAGWK